MAGGTASGKTEFAYSYLNKSDQLVYDGTLKSFDGFKIKLQRIERYDKNKSKVKVVLIIPKDWIRAFEAFLRRERKMKPQTFFETHIRSRLTVAKILTNTKIKTEIYVSEVKEGTDKLHYIKVKVSGKRRIILEDLISTAKYLQNMALQNGIEINANYDII